MCRTGVEGDRDMLPDLISNLQFGLQIESFSLYIMSYLGSSELLFDQENDNTFHGSLV